ncbi:MAG TPA: ribosomal protein S18-alanine N-acetyltransferase [bacterium]|nr:ribosomal protein S18-alanine N-acetyltransferase [bacterium]
MTALALRRMVRGDLDQVVALERRIFAADAWSRQMFVQELRNSHRPYLVLVDGETVIGYGGLWLDPPDAEISNIAVAPEYRGQGLGRLLMEVLLSTAEAAGCLRIALTVRVSNTVAQTLYTDFGFRIDHREAGYYQDNGEDAYVMVRNSDAVGGEATDH